MVWLLDTNVVSELRKVGAGKGDPGVAIWQSKLARSDMYISAITACALVYGMTVVTRNRRNFAGTGVPILDPWAAY